MRVMNRFRVGVVLCVILVLLSGVPSMQTSGNGGIWYVQPDGDDNANPCNDHGPDYACATINGALAKASAGDTILVAADVYIGTEERVVLLDKNIQLSGGWNLAFTTQIGYSTLDGQSTRRVVLVNSGVTANMNHFIVKNGSYGGGAGVFNNGTLTMEDCSIENNSASVEGGGVFVQYGATLTLNRCSVKGNSANSGGGIFIAWGDG